MGNRRFQFPLFGREARPLPTAIVAVPQSIRIAPIQVWERWSRIANVLMSPDATNDGT